MKPSLDRRQFLQATLAASVAIPAISQPETVEASKQGVVPPRLGFSLYGMKGLPLDEAIRTCAAIGYDDVELSLLPGYLTEPTQFGKAARTELRELLAAQQIEVSCLMENLVLATSDVEHRKNLDRIARAAELVHDLGCGSIMETVLGGKPADWPQVRGPMTDRLRDWAETARKHKLIVAIKPHVGGAVHLPESAKQLLDDVDSPHLKVVYDFSHYLVQGLKLEPTLATLADRTVFVHVKDGRRIDGKVQFLLPGDGDVNYTTLYDQLRKHRFQGTVAVEVSGQIFNRPEYDPRVAAQRSYDHLIAVWKRPELPAPLKKP